MLFDMDGTLIEFKFKIKESRIAMIDLLRQRGYETNDYSENMRTQDIIDDAKHQWIKSKELGQTDFSKLQKDLFKILDDFEFEAMKQSTPHPGSLSIVRKIKKAQMLTGVVTNSGRLPAESMLAEYGFMPYLSVLITRNEAPKMKPSPDGLLLATRELGVGALDVLYVGDSILDIEASRLAQVKCAAVPSGLYNAERLQKRSPDFMLRTIDDLEKIVLF
ncbi:MAG: HAD family hydrolase [Nitrososphaerales archaeon]